MTKLESNDITIDLGASTSACVFENNTANLIQHEAVDQFWRILKEHLKQAQAKDAPASTGIYYQRPHNTIMIDGERGTGKTTFILNMIAAIKDAKQDWKNEIQPLRVVDPTLMDSKEHILLTVIMLVKKTVEATIKPNDTDITKWKKSLDKLAKGICMLDGVGRENFKSELWNDYQSIMEDGLSETEHCFNLEINLHEFFNESLLLIDRKAFLLAFDDIDTNFNIGFPVLETLRKYLTSPKLITILSGDIELYSSLIHKAQFENFTKDYTSFRGTITGNKDKIDPKLEQTIDRLEEQYIQKILQPAYRISLKFAKECIDSKKQIKITHPNKQNEPPQDINKIIDEITNKIFNLQTNELRALGKEAITNCPIRTTLNAIRAIAANFPNGWSELSKPRVEIQQEIESCKTSLINTFITSVIKIGYSPAELPISPQPAIWEKFLEKLLQIGSIQENYRLLPINTSNITNQTFVTLNNYYSISIQQSPHLLFSYILKICLTGHIQKNLSYRNNKEVADDKFIKYIKYSKLNKASSTQETSLLAATFMRSAPYHSEKTTARQIDETPIKFGSILLYSDSIGKKITPRLKSWQTDLQKSARIESDLTTLGQIDSRKFGILSPSAVIQRTAEEQYPFISVFIILGAIESCLKSTTEDEIAAILTSLNRMKPVPTIDASIEQNEKYKTGSHSKSEVTDTDDNLDSEEKSGRDDQSEPDSAEIAKLMFTWSKNFNFEFKKSPLPVHTIANAWERFANALESLDSDLSRQNQFRKYHTGALIHRTIILFLNSLMVEECLHTNPLNGSKLRTKNPITIDSIFNSNRIKASPFTPITNSMINCPLIQIYIDKKSPAFDNNLNHLNVFEELSRVLYRNRTPNQEAKDKAQSE